MGKFFEYRIHFDMSKKGVFTAHSDPIKVEEIEKYKKVFGCGVSFSHYITGNLHWIADPIGKDENARRLALEWLDELGNEFPGKAKVIREMLK
jgi:hypothetical protein